MNKHTVQNLAIAIIVPTILFTMTLFGISHIKPPKPTVGTFAQDSITYLQGQIEAAISLRPYLDFDSIPKASYFGRQGLNYYVDLSHLFPNTGLKGLRAYTTDEDMAFCDFFCDGGHVCSGFIVKHSNEYIICDQSDKEIKQLIRLGHPSFDLRDDLWHNLAYYGGLTYATIILFVSLAIIIISSSLYHDDTEVSSLIGATIIITVWLLGYNGQLGQDKFYEFDWLICLYIALCWLCSIISLFFPLEDRSKLFLKGQREDKEEKEKQEVKKKELEKRLSNGVDSEYIYGRWIEVGNNECSLTFNPDGTAFYTDDTKIDIYKYTVNSDSSVILNKGEEQYFVRHWFKNKIKTSFLVCGNKSFTRNGKSIDDLQNEYNEKEKKKRQNEEKEEIIDEILGFQSRHSGGNIVISMLFTLLGSFFLAYGIVELFGTGYSFALLIKLCLNGMIFIWGIIRIYHKILFSKRMKLIVMCNNVYGKLDRKELMDYLRYCRKHGDVSMEEYLNNK